MPARTIMVMNNTAIMVGNSSDFSNVFMMLYFKVISCVFDFSVRIRLLLCRSILFRNAFFNFFLLY